MPNTVVIGRLTDNPTLKTIKGKDCALFSLYQTMSDKTTITQKVVSFGKQAKTVMQYLRKGNLCCIEGIIDDKKVIGATRITFLSSNKTQECDN